MPKNVINEGLIDKFLIAVFNSVLKGKQSAILKMMDKDPKLKKLTRDAQDSIEKLQKHAKWKVKGADSDLWTRK